MTAPEPGTTNPAADDRFYAALLDDDADELYENAPCGYLSLLPDGTIIKANATFLRWTGYERATIIGRRRFSELLPAGDRIFYETHFAPLLRMQGQVREVAVELVLDDGRRLPVLVNALVKIDDDGTPIVARVAVFDATERRSYELELLAARRRAEASEQRAVALAHTLQASLLPPTVLQPAGLSVGAGYRPAGDGSEVGGDFYDIFETADGSAAIVLGDIAGKGVEAAVLTSLARHTIRTEALHQPEPTHVLSTVADAFLRYHPDAYCTAVFIVIAPDRTRATIAVGGHHLPVCRRADGPLVRVGERGRLLGLLPEPVIGESTVDLHGGDTLVVFTDGVVEARRDQEFFDDDGVTHVLAGTAGSSAQETADALVDAALAFQAGDPQDDIAVVAVQVDR